MSFSKDILRNRAKKAYKEQTKNVPKKKRISFQQFYKQFIKFNSATSAPNVDKAVEEDFDIGAVVNVNSIDSDSLIVDANTEKDGTEI